MQKLIDRETNWYALYTKPRSEKKVYERLSQDGFDAYLPLITTLRQWSDRKKKVQLPLISSYVFINTDEPSLKKSLSVEGVLRVLKHLGKAAIIKEFEINNLKILLEDPESITFVSDIHVLKGDSVIVEKGMFKGLVAECIKLNGKHRIVVRIEGIENVIEVNIPLSHVKKISNKIT